MTTFTNVAPSQIYGDLLTTTNSGQGLSSILNPLQDALGNNSTVQIANNAIDFSRTNGNTFQLDGVALTATAININNICKPNPVIPGTGGIVLPGGNTSQRPAGPSNGTIRYNSQIDELEFSSNSQWHEIMSGDGALTIGTEGLSTTLASVDDLLGNASPLELATNAVNIDRGFGNTFQLDGVALTATAIQINSICNANPAFISTSALSIPKGTTAQRPAPVEGDYRFNSQTKNFEGYDGTSWKVFTIV